MIEFFSAVTELHMLVQFLTVSSRKMLFISMSVRPNCQLISIPGKSNMPESSQSFTNDEDLASNEVSQGLKEFGLQNQTLNLR